MPKVQKLTQSSQPENEIGEKDRDHEKDRATAAVTDLDAEENGDSLEKKDEAKPAYEIGQGWDGATDGKDSADRELDDSQVAGSENTGVPPDSADDHADSIPASSGPDHGSLKRRREDEPGVPEQAQDGAAYGQDHGQDYGRSYQPKRSRQECFRCGGAGHIAVMCISEFNAKHNMNLPTCRVCNGRGHMARDCPNSIPSGVCFKCKREGHRGRDCPMSGPVGGPGPPGVGGYGMPVMSGGYPQQGGYYEGSGYGHQGMYDGYGLPAGGVGYDRPMYVGESYGRPPRPTVGSGRCFRCNEPGHWTRDCPYRPADADPNGCYKCGKAGHRAKDCSMCFKCKGYGHNPFECPAGVQ